MQFIFGSFKKKNSREGNLPQEFHFIAAFGLLQSELVAYLEAHKGWEVFKVQVHPKKEGGSRMVQPTPYLLLQGPIQIFSYWNHPSECEKLAWIRCSPHAQETCHFFLLYRDEFLIVTLINGPMNTIIRVIWFFPPIYCSQGNYMNDCTQGQEHVSCTLAQSTQVPGTAGITRATAAVFPR